MENTPMLKTRLLSVYKYLITKITNKRFFNAFYLLALTFLLSHANSLSAQCPTDVDLTSQTDVDNFSTNFPDCVTQGWMTNLTLTGNITDISEIYVIDSIVDELTFSNTDLLTIDAYNTLKFAKELNIVNNASLTTIGGFTGLTEIEELDIDENEALTSFSGFDNVMELNDLYFAENNMITDFSALNSIERIRETSVFLKNTGLTTISGLQNLEIVGEELVFNGNTALNIITGLTSLEETANLYVVNSDLDDLQFLSGMDFITFQLVVTENDSLTDISALSNLSYLGNLILSNNSVLNECCVVNELRYSGKLNGLFALNNADPDCSSYANFINACPDADEDGILDANDNCPNNKNADQADSDSDGIGNGCDNCPTVSNADQADDDGNGIGDLCETTQVEYSLISDTGDIVVGESNKGLILKSINGTCYRIIINDQGEIETYTTVCPD